MKYKIKINKSRKEIYLMKNGTTTKFINKADDIKDIYDSLLKRMSIVFDKRPNCKNKWRYTTKFYKIKKTYTFFVDTLILKLLWIF